MSSIITVFFKEIKDSIRDRRTLLTAVLMPIFLMPVIMIGSLKFQEYQQKSTEQKKAIIAVSNEAAAPTLMSFLKSQEKITIKSTTDYNKDIDSGTINAFLQVPDDFEKQLAVQTPAKISVFQKSSNLDSQSALPKVTIALQQFNEIESVKRLQEKKIDPSVITVLAITPVDISTATERGGFFIGLLLPMFIVLFAIIGGMYIAIDVSAGEKERKTLEALILTPASRFEIVAGKFLAVASTASASSVLSLFSLYAAFKLFPPSFGDASVIINLSPASIGIMLGIGVILAIMFSGLLLSVAIFAKSYKEAQNYITPFYLIAVLPVAIFAQIPGLKPTLPMFLLPGVNGVFVIKEVIVGAFDTGHILVTIGSLLVYAVIAIIVASSIYSKEGILFRD